VNLTALVTSAVALLQSLASVVPANSSFVLKAIAFLEQLIPLAVKEVQDEIPVIKNLIAALAGKTDDATLLSRLSDLDAQVDAAYEAAKAKWADVLEEPNT
jgi:hypothetical protein